MPLTKHASSSYRLTAFLESCMQSTVSSSCHVKDFEYRWKYAVSLQICTIILLMDICELQTVQLYEMIIVRHGLMVVGLPFSGKSCMLRVLAGALSDLKEQGKLGPLFDKVEMRVLNPKSVTMGQLYGENDKATQEWKVGKILNTASYFSKDL